MPDNKTFWTDYLKGEMWVVDPSGIPVARNLSTGAYADKLPSDVDRQFTLPGSLTPEDAQRFPYASQYVSGASPTPSREPTASQEAGRFQRTTVPSTAVAPSAVGQIPELNPDDFYEKWDDVNKIWVPARAGESGAIFNDDMYYAAVKARQDAAQGFPGGGRTGPTAAELAIERSKVHAQNLATFVNGTVAELEAEIAMGQLETDQAIAEFDRRMDAFTEAGTQFREIQPYTIPIGAEYAPGFQPGGIGERLGIEPRPAEVVQYDPFGMAAEIVASTPTITDIGVPSGDALSDAVRQAEQFIGG